MSVLHLVRRHRALVALLLLPGLLLRAAIPSGFMPGHGSGLGVTIELCTSHGLQRVVVEPDGDTAPITPASHAESPCAFALTAVAAPPPLGVPAVAASAPVIVPAVEFRTTGVARPAVRASSPRGPPALV
jgi:hypothetical protein